MRYLARRRWKQHHSAACLSAQKKEFQEAEEHHSAALAEAKKLPADDPREAKTLRALASMLKEKGDFSAAVEALQKSISSQEASPKRGQRLKKLACSFTEMAELQLELGTHEAATDCLEQAVELFRAEIVSMTEHREKVRRFREAGISSWKNIHQLIDLSVVGIRQLSGSLEALTTYPQALEMLTVLYIDADKPSEAIKLQRELIDFKITTGIFPEEAILDDLTYALNLQREHQLFDQDSPTLAQRLLTITMEREGLEQPELLPALSLVESTNYALDNFEDALSSATQGYAIASQTWGERSLEALRWLLLTGRDNFALGEHEQARSAAQKALASLHENGSEKTSEYYWALELEAMAELAGQHERRTPDTGKKLTQLTGPGGVIHREPRKTPR